MARAENLDGDQQADRSVHGGPDKAVYAYPVEHYDAWRADLPGVELPWGTFGENLSCSGGWFEDAVRIGDRFRIGVLGLSFKPGTDDLRESPMVTLIETLIGKGLQILIFDREVELARLFGANKEYIEQEIPHISSLMRRRLDEVLDQSEVIVLTKRSDEYREALQGRNQPPLIIDLARVIDTRPSDAVYQGIGW